MVHFLQLKFQIAFLNMTKSHWLVSCGEEVRENILERKKSYSYILFPDTTLFQLKFIQNMKEIFLILSLLMEKIGDTSRIIPPSPL